MQYHFLHLPLNRFSPIHYLMETTKYWSESDSILIGISAYKEMGENPFLKQNGNIWIAEEATINGRCYPALSYELKQIKFGLWEVRWIKYDGKCYEFSTKKFGESFYLT